MSQTIQIKRSSGNAAPGSLLEGEFAWVDHGTGGADGKLYIGDAASGTIIDIAGSAYAPLNSGDLTGSPTAPTPTAGDNSTRIATTAFVDAAVLTKDTVLELQDTNIGSIIATQFAEEDDVDVNASGMSEFVVEGENDDDVEYTTETNYIQQEWTNSNQSTSQATVASGTTVTISSGTWPTNCVNGRISFDSGSTWFDIELRDSNTELTLTTSATNGTFDYIIRLSEFDSGSVQLNYSTNTVTSQGFTTSTGVALDMENLGAAGSNADQSNYDRQVYLVNTANVELNSSVKKYGSKSLYLKSGEGYMAVDGGSDPTYSKLQLCPSSSSDLWTLDFYINFTQYQTGQKSFWAHGASSANYFSFEVGGNSVWAEIYDNQGGGNILPSWSHPTANYNLNQWYHWSFIKGWGGNSQTVAFCQDGTVVNTFTWPSNFYTPQTPTTDFMIGKGAYTTNRSPDGVYIDNMSFRQDAVWTANFTPPTTLASNISTTTNYGNPISEYTSVVTSEAHNPDTSGWVDINSASITETTDSNSDVYYWLGFDPASGYGDGTEAKIFHQGDSVWRTIAKNNSGTWEYNSSVLVAGGYTSDVTSGETFTTDNPISSGVIGNVFDDSNSTNVDFMTSGTALLPRHIAVEYASAKTVTKVTINCNGSEGRGKNVTFKVQGSNDNSNWTDLHTETGYNFATGNSSSDSFTFSNSTSYLHYRIRWENSAHTAASPSQNGGFPTMYEIEMMESTPGVTADAYSGTTATTNDMLHAVSQAVSTVSENRMTEAQAEAISDAEFEETDGFVPGTTSSLFRGTTLYSTTATSNASVDQYTLNFTGSFGDNMFGRSGENNTLAQIFQSTKSSELHSAKMFIKTVGSPTDNVRLKLYSVTGSVGEEVPDTLLDTSDNIAANTMTSSYVEYTFSFENSVNTVSGTKYAIVAERTGSLDDTNYYRAQGQDADVYNLGHIAEYDGADWSVVSSKDLSLNVISNVLQETGAGKVLVYDGTDSWDDKEITGAFTLDKTGATTLTASGISNIMISGSAAIANSKLENSTISGVSLGDTLNVLTAGTGFSTGTYDGSSAVTFNVDGLLEDLDTLGAPSADGEFIVADGAGSFAYESGSTVRDSLDLGASDTPTFTGMNAGGAAITNLADPSNAQDLATKAYVASVEYGFDFKESVVAATTADLSATYNNGTAGVGATLTGSTALPQIDGISLSNGHRVLVKDQTLGAENGIYVVTDSSNPFTLTRAEDADNPSEFTAGAFVFVEQGTVAADNAYLHISDGAVTFGTSVINWQQFTGAGAITAGSGLTKSGNTIQIDPAYVGQTSIVTLGTITTGTWEATRISATYGGTNIDTGSSTGIPQIVNGTWTVPSTVAPLYGGLGLDTSSSTGIISVSGGTWTVDSHLDETEGGTGIDTSSSTGIPQIINGTWTVPSTVAPLYGGTGTDSSAETGLATVNNGVWEYIPILDETQGGTGIGSWTAGDMVVADGTSTMVQLSAGSSGAVMNTSDAGMPSWDGIEGGVMSSVSLQVSISSSGVNTKIGKADSSPEKVGQTALMTSGGTLNRVQFKVKRIGNPTDTYVAKVAEYALTNATINNNLSSNTDPAGASSPNWYEGCIFSGGAYQAYSSNFTPSSDISISSITYEVSADSPSSSQEYTLEIYPTSSGKPVRTDGNDFSGSGVSGFNSGRGPSLVASDTYNTGGLSSSSWSTVTANFSTSYTLTAGTEYAVVFCPVGSSNGQRVCFRTQAGNNNEAYGYDGGWLTGLYSPTQIIGMNIVGTSQTVGSVLATSDARSASSVSTIYNMIEYNFSGANKISLSNATEYAFYLERTGTLESSNILAMDTESADSYADGEAISFDGTNWTAHTDREHNLKVWYDD